MVVVGLMALILSAVGCGGSDSTLTAKEFEQQLKVACNDGAQESNEVYEQISNIYSEGKRKPTRGFQTENLEKMMGVYENTTEKIAEIGLPEEGAEQAEALIQAREDAAAKTAADVWGTRNEYLVIFKDANERAKGLRRQRLHGLSSDHPLRTLIGKFAEGWPSHRVGAIVRSARSAFTEAELVGQPQRLGEGVSHPVGSQRAAISFTFFDALLEAARSFLTAGPCPGGNPSASMRWICFLLAGITTSSATSSIFSPACCFPPGYGPRAY